VRNTGNSGEGSRRFWGAKNGKVGKYCLRENYYPKWGSRCSMRVRVHAGESAHGRCGVDIMKCDVEVGKK